MINVVNLMVHIVGSDGERNSNNNKNNGHNNNNNNNNEHLFPTDRAPCRGRWNTIA